MPEEISGANVSNRSVAQFWDTRAEARAAAGKGMDVVRSSAGPYGRPAGVTFWLSRNTLSGSYVALTAASRSQVVPG